MIRRYKLSDDDGLCAAYNSFARRNEYVPFSLPEFRQHVTWHLNFCPQHTFVLEENGCLQGFICGCSGDLLPYGTERGYITCVALHDEFLTIQNVSLLVAHIERSFYEAGRKKSACMFYNPMRLPWIIRGTDNRQHNNAPGIDTESNLFSYLRTLRYDVTGKECAMYLDLASFSVPQHIAVKQANLAAEGYTIEPFDPIKNVGLERMLEELRNPLWCTEVSEAAAAGQFILTALHGNTVAGFTGPIYPEKTGRGYFAGIGVAPEWAGRGLGTVLFYRLCEAEKSAGSAYMSLFTGIDNPARTIYEKAGFTVVRTFGLLSKTITDK